jgi:hypothetical protein
LKPLTFYIHSADAFHIGGQIMVNRKAVAKVMKGVRVTPTVAKQIQTMADVERRSWSAMAEILLEEAVNARAKK